MARRLGVGVAIVVALPLVLLLGLLALAQTPWGQRLIAGQLEGALAGPARTAEVEGLHGTLPVDMRLDRLALADPDGIWLEVEDVRLAWSFTALLRGRLQVDVVRAAEIRLARLPATTDEPEPEAPPEPIRLPELPERLPLAPVVEQLAVDLIRLESPVLGQPVSLTLDGRLRTAPGGENASLELDLERVDEASARAAVRAELGLAPPSLELNVSAVETGGLLAAVSGQEQAGDFRLELLGRGSLEDWQGELDLSAEGLASLDARFETELEDVPRVAVEAALQPEPGALPDDLAQALGQRITLALDLQQPGAQQLSIDELSIVAGAIALGGAGEVDFESQTIDAIANLEVARLQPLEAIAGVPLAGSATLELQAQGDLRKPSGRLSLDGQDLSVAGVEAAGLRSDFDWRFLRPLDDRPAVLVRGDGGVERLALADGPPLPERDVAWQVTMSAPFDGRIDVEELMLAGEHARLSLTGGFDPTVMSGDLDLRLAATALGPLSAPYGQRVEGAAELSAAVSIEEQLERITVRLEGGTERLAGLPEPAMAVAGEEVTLAALAEIVPGSVARLRRLALEAATLSLAGEASLGLGEEQPLDGALELTMPELSPLAPAIGQELAGAAQAQLDLGGTLAAPALAIAVQGRELVAAGQVIDALDLELTALGPVQSIEGDARLVVQTPAVEEARLAGRYQLAGQTLIVNDLLLGAPATKVEGALTVDLERTLIDGQIEGQVVDLAALRALVPFEPRGQIELALRLRPQDAQQGAALTLQAQDVESTLAAVRRVTLQAEVQDALGTPSLDASTEINGLRQGANRIESLSASARGPLSALDVAAEVEGEVGRRLTLETDGTLRIQDTLALELAGLSGAYGELPFRLVQPAQLSMAGETIRLTDLDLALGDGRLRGGLALDQRAVDLEATLTELPLGLLTQFGAPDLKGEVRASLRVEGPVEGPQGQLDLRVSDLRSAALDLAELPAADLRLEAVLADGRLQADLRASGLTERPATARLAVPVVLKLQPFQAQLAESAPLEGALDARLQLERFADLLPVDDQRVAGTFRAALSLEGTVAEPIVDGDLTLENGLYENGLTGTVLRDIRLRAEASRQELRIEELSASDGGDGTLSAEGALAIDPSRAFPYQLDLRLRDATLIRRDDLEATLGGRIELAGDSAAASLSGRIRVQRAEAGIPSGGGPNVAVLEVEEVGGEVQEVETEVEPSDGFKLRLDLTIEIPGQVFVRGRGLESEWQGDLTVTGTAEQPVLEGELEVRRGRFDFLDKRFDIERGVISFGGAVPPDPTLDIEAVADGADVRAIVRFTGPASDPELKLDSEPPLPEDEVLAQLLFDKPLSEIGAADAVSLAAALNRLRGGSGGLDLLGRTRDALGVDTLEVGGDLNEQRVKAGKYLSDEVYVEVETGTAKRSGRARVEVEIVPSLSIEADTSQDAASGVGLKWKYDF